MTKPTTAPFKSRTHRAIVVTLGWRKLLIPFNHDNLATVTKFMALTEGQGYDQCYADAEWHHLTGGENNYLVPDQKLTLAIEEVLIANRHLTADDAMPAAVEDGDHPAPLAVAAE